MTTVHIERNEAKIKDLSIPLFELEQRTEILENQFTKYQTDTMDKMTAKVAARFNDNLRDYLPNVDKAIKTFKQFKD